MPRTDRRLRSTLVTLALVAANLVVFNLVVARLGPVRVDLTEDRQFSVTEPTRRLLDSLDEEVTVYGYFSRRTHPKLAPLVPQIRDMLAEYRSVADGRVRVVFVDPTEDEAAAQEASDRFGVRSAPFRLASKYETGIVNAWFALVVRFGDRYERYGYEDLIEVDVLPDGDVDVRLGNLEYDLTRAIKKVVYGFRGAGDLFARIEDPVRLTAVVSSATLPESFADVPEAVRKAAEELTEAGGDRFSYVEVDPTADETLRDDVAQRFGARPMTLGLFGGEPFWLYAFLEVGDEVETIPIVGEDVSAAEIREEVEDALRRRTPGFLKTIGLVTPDPQIPPEVLMELQMRGQAPPTPPEEFQQLRALLQRDYRVTRVDLGSGDVPSDVDVLLVAKPSGLTDEDVYRLDQYLMRGGRVLICSGRYEADFGARGLALAPVASGLDDWLAGQGVRIEDTLVLDDVNQALPIPEVRMTPLGPVRTWTMAPYPYLVEVRDEGFADREVAGNLAAMGLYWASPVDAEPSEGLEVRPLLRSSSRSWTDDDPSSAAFVDYTVPEETEPHLLAVALTGRFRSAWATREPSADDDGEGEGGGRRAVPVDGAVPLEESPDTRLVVIGNAEFLSDFVARALGTDEGGFFAENLAYIQNAIDWMLLDNDMIAIRSRAATVRRLPTIEDGARASIEAANYLLSAAALAAIAAWVVWRRRSAPVPVSIGSGSRRSA